MISVVGHTAIDHIITVLELPQRHKSTPVLDHKVYGGGGAANIAVGIAVLGGDAELISAVGKEFIGGEYDAFLKKNNVKTRFFVSEDKRTSTCYMFNDPKGDQTTVFEWGAGELFTTEKAPKLDFVHMATGEAEFNVSIAQQAEFASFDPGQDLIKYTKEQLLSLIDNIDILFCNHHELATICEKLGQNSADVLKQIPTSIVTMSEKGSRLYTNNSGNVKEIPAVKADFVEPTGAGDGYRAGFFTALQKGYPMDICCKVGAVTSSFVVEKVGCQTNLADWDIMLTRYREFFGEMPLPPV